MKLKRPLWKASVHFPSNNCINIAVDNSTGAVFIGWYQTKKKFIDSFCSKLDQWETTTKGKVLRIRCDILGRTRRSNLLSTATGGRKLLNLSSRRKNRRGTQEWKLKSSTSATILSRQWKPPIYLIGSDI